MKKGFTIMELLVVIAIIGILASIILIAFQNKNGTNCLETREDCVSDCYEREEKCILDE